jgi:hypothetical protein
VLAEATAASRSRSSSYNSEQQNEGNGISSSIKIPKKDELLNLVCSSWFTATEVHY